MRKTDEPRRSEGNHRLMTSWPVLTLTISHPDMFSTFKLFSASKTVKLPHALTRLLWVCVCVVRCGPASHQIPYHLTSFRSSAPHGHSSTASVLLWPFAPPARTMDEGDTAAAVCICWQNVVLFLFCFVHGITANTEHVKQRWGSSVTRLHVSL